MASHRSAQSVFEHARRVVSERRLAPRLAQADVPWLRALKPNVIGSARLLNISNTGVLLDTSDRLLPGRRATVVALADDERMERLNGIVVRTHVVSIGKGTGLVYRTALEFEKAFPWELGSPATAAAIDEAPKVETTSAEAMIADLTSEADKSSEGGGALEGPIEGLLSTDAGSQFVPVTNLTETGCIVKTGEPVKPGDWISIAVLFSQSKRPLLAGRVTSITGDGRCLMRFVNLAASEREVLRY